VTFVAWAGTRRVSLAHQFGPSVWPRNQTVPGSGYAVFMVEIHVKYAGQKKCDLTHPEGPKLRTDAPKDIGGDATAFSPTDLIAAGLASCIVTTIAMWAERHQLEIGPARASVQKHMTTPPSPRRLGRLPVVVELSKGIPVEMRERLEKVGHSCPVHASLHPEVDAPIEYRYVL
jgi:putative redox protein